MEEQIMSKVNKDFDMYIEQLRLAHCDFMADELSNLINETGFHDMNVKEVIDRLVTAQFMGNRNHMIELRKKQALLSEPNANLIDIDYSPERKLNKSQIEDFASNMYIKQKHNIILLGPTGCGKTFLANALAVKACEDLYRVRIVTMFELLNEISAATITGQDIERLIKKYLKYDVLIIDDFLITIIPKESEKNVIYQILDKRIRSSNGSLIICSQISPQGWCEKLGGDAIAEGIIDRITSNAYKIIMQGES